MIKNTPDKAQIKMKIKQNASKIAHKAKNIEKAIKAKRQRSS